jgi:hypothetical protein
MPGEGEEDERVGGPKAPAKVKYITITVMPLCQTKFQYWHIFHGLHETFLGVEKILFIDINSLI